MDQRREFVRLAQLPSVNRRELCRRFGISPETGYKWLRRWEAEGDPGLADQSRRPARSPGQTCERIEEHVLAIRDQHPAWGARKIARRLEMEGEASPAVSTVHAILERNDRVHVGQGGSPGKSWTRFEMSQPNQLWQMDFKGWVPLTGGQRCHPLTIVDDHSRFAVCLRACRDQTTETVRSHLDGTFRRYGLPDAMFVDNGSPWSDSSGQPWTRLAVWLIKLGIHLIRSRPYHPQSRGKNERFHRTLHSEVFALRRFNRFKDVQAAFDEWRQVYNCDRPHEALGQQPPVTRFRPSARPMPVHPLGPQYDEREIVRRVLSNKGYISFRNRMWNVPKALCGEYVAIRPSAQDGVYGIFFGAHRVGDIDLTSP